MRVHIQYFAGLRESLGVAGEDVDLPGNVDTVAALRHWLAERGRESLATAKNLRFAVNQEMAQVDATIQGGDEIAFFPPVTGG